MDALAAAQDAAQHASGSGVGPEARSRLLGEVQAYATLATAEALHELAASWGAS